MPNRSTSILVKTASNRGPALAAGLIFLVACAALPLAQAQTAPAAEADEPVPTFAAQFMKDAKVIGLGRDAWQQQCRHCHGNSAYPGKAPKLSAGTLDPVFIFDRVTYGFKGMPPWRAVFTRDQRLALVAYIKSDSFSP